uniref:Maturase K n=1 Tax=Panagrolaimus sp. JU765 TaxID=591449 RepID=A0AC34QL22_9BILA
MDDEDDLIIAFRNYPDVVLSCRFATKQEYENYLSKRLSTVLELNRFEKYPRIKFQTLDVLLQYRLYKISSPRIQATMFESSKALSKFSKNRPRIFVIKYSSWDDADKCPRSFFKYFDNVVIHILKDITSFTGGKKVGNIWNHVYFHLTKWLCLEQMPTLDVVKLTSNKPILKVLTLKLDDELKSYANFALLMDVLDTLPCLEFLQLEISTLPCGWEKLFYGRFQKLK